MCTREFPTIVPVPSISSPDASLSATRFPVFSHRTSLIVVLALSSSVISSAVAVVAVAAKQHVPNNIETIINSFISHAPCYVWHTKRSHSKFNHRLRIPHNPRPASRPHPSQRNSDSTRRIRRPVTIHVPQGLQRKA